MSAQHTPTPWEIVWERDAAHNPPRRAQSIGPVDADHDHWSGWTICDEADAEFIKRACNSHDALLAALETWVLWFRQGEKAPLYRSEQAIKEARVLGGQA